MISELYSNLLCCGKLTTKVLVWDSVSEVWELAGYLNSIQYYPAPLRSTLRIWKGIVRDFPINVIRYFQSNTLLSMIMKDVARDFPIDVIGSL